MRIHRKLRKYNMTYISKQGKVVIPALLLVIGTVVLSIGTPIENTTDTESTTPEATLEVVKETKQPAIIYSHPLESPQTEKIEANTVAEPEETKEVFKHPESCTEDIKMYTTSSVHLRSEANQQSNSLTILPAYQIITIHIVEGNWGFVQQDNIEGWVNLEYTTNYRENEYVDIPLEFYYQDLVRNLIGMYDLDIDEYFIYGMMYTENRFNNEEESSAGAQGILQIMPSTWSALYKTFCEEYPEFSKNIKNDATDKYSNITLAMYYIKQLRDSYGCQSVSNNASKILTAYNRGIGGANSYYKSYGTYSTSYSREILRAAEYIRVNKTWKEGL